MQVKSGVKKGVYSESVFGASLSQCCSCHCQFTHLLSFEAASLVTLILAQLATKRHGWNVPDMTHISRTGDAS
jgi:hypothetical protein